MSCGTGSETRQVSCHDSQGSETSDYACAQTTKPSINRACANVVNC